MCRIITSDGNYPFIKKEWFASNYTDKELPTTFRAGIKSSSDEYYSLSKEKHAYEFDFKECQLISRFPILHIALSTKAGSQRHETQQTQTHSYRISWKI